MNVNIFIESSVKGTKRKNGVVGFVLEAGEEEKYTLTQFGTVADVTENQAQLLALKYALKRVNDKSSLRIWTDNTYMAAAFEQGWIKGWLERDWTTAKGKEVANKEEWKDILEMLEEKDPFFEIDKPHTYKNWMKAEVERRAKKYV